MLYIFISLVSYSSVDPSFSSLSSQNGTVENLGGPFGAYLSDALFSALGLGAYLILFIASYIAVRLIFFYQTSSRLNKIIKLASILVLLSSFSALCEYYYSGDLFPQSSSGGLLGALFFTSLSGVFGIVGSLIFIIIFFLASISLTFSFSWLLVVDGFGSGSVLIARTLGAKLNSLFQLILKYHFLKVYIENILDLPWNQ